MCELGTHGSLATATFYGACVVEAREREIEVVICDYFITSPAAFIFSCR